MARDRFKRWGARHSRVKRQLHNPYFHRKERGYAGRWTGWRSLGIGILCIAGAAVLVIVPFEAVTNAAFTVEQVTFALPHVLPEQQRHIQTLVQAVLDKPLPFDLQRKNFFLFPRQEIEERIRAEVPYATVVLSGHFPKGMTITVTQPQRLFSVSDGTQTGFVTEDGGVLDLIAHEAAVTSSTVVFEHRDQVSSTAAALIPVVMEQQAGTSTTAWTTEQEVLPKNCATLISFFDAGLSAVDLNGTVYQVNADKTAVRIFTREGVSLMTDPIVNPRDQLNRLIALLKDPRYAQRQKIASIDLRYPGKAYITEKGS